MVDSSAFRELEFHLSSTAEVSILARCDASRNFPVFFALVQQGNAGLASPSLSVFW